MYLKNVWGVLLACAFVSSSWAASCNTSALPKQARPDWINNPSPEQAASRFFGLGTAEIVGNDLSKALSEARARANSELAQSVSVSVRSTLRSAESKLTENGKTAVQSKFEALTDSVADLTLKSVSVDGQWVDADECRVWLRVALPRAEAERAQKAAMATRLVEAFAAQLTLVGSASRPVIERERAMAAATEILNLIDTALVPTFSMDGARINVEALQPTLIEAKRIYTGYRELLLSHQKAFAQLNAATAAGPRRTAATAALTGLQSMLSLAPAGMAGLPLPFDSTERATALFTELGTQCMAQQWFMERNKVVPSAFKSASTSCTVQDVSRERRQLYLAGRSVFLTCTLNVDGQNKPWEKVCASMQEKLSRDGVVILTAIPAQGADVVHRMNVSATGVLKKRVDAEEKTTQFRFEGAIASSFKGPNQIDIQDKYEGITGWNSVSANMTTDVLALNVAARLDAAISKTWEK